LARILAPAASSAPTFRTLPPLSLYVHLPWCLKKCPYCDFNSHEWRGGDAGPPEDAYVDALVADLERALPAVWGRKVSTVFLGGGTPSLFSPEAIDRLLAAIRARLPLVAGAEVTMEANPGTFERRRFEGFRDAGVNRLSVGVQSFAPRHPRRPGATPPRCAPPRRRGRAEHEVNRLDVRASAARRRGCRCRGAHVPHDSSCYTPPPNTPFHRDPPELPDEDGGGDGAGSRRGCRRRADHYEVSHARSGTAARTTTRLAPVPAPTRTAAVDVDRIVREVRWKQPKQHPSARRRVSRHGAPRGRARRARVRVR
jgi:oxygen-independent coproporphyrinogen-3 oxidase